MAFFSACDLTWHVGDAIKAADKATAFDGPIVEGMTSIKVRTLLRELCRLPHGHYLEIGAWKGATLLAAIHRSTLIQATAIDNWSTFGGPREEFQANLDAHRNWLPPLRVLDADCWTVPLEQITPRVNVFFYDGSHKTEDQKRAMTRFWPVLFRPAIVVVDDWDDPNYDVPGGTRDGLAEVGAEIVAEWERHTAFQADASGWWNGVFVAVVQ